MALPGCGLIPDHFCGDRALEAPAWRAEFAIEVEQSLMPTLTKATEGGPAGHLAEGPFARTRPLSELECYP